MSITRLLFLAGLLAVGACGTGTGPNGICYTDGTECTYESATPPGDALLPGDNQATVVVHKWRYASVR